MPRNKFNQGGKRLGKILRHLRQKLKKIQINGSKYHAHG